MPPSASTSCLRKRKMWTALMYSEYMGHDNMLRTGLGSSRPTLKLMERIGNRELGASARPERWTLSWLWWCRVRWTVLTDERRWSVGWGQCFAWRLTRFVFLRESEWPVKMDPRDLAICSRRTRCFRRRTIRCGWEWKPCRRQSTTLTHGSLSSLQTELTCCLQRQVRDS